RSDQVQSNALPKYQLWATSGGGEYQIAISSALQWDPAAPRARVDWVPRNVMEMQQALARSNSNDLMVVCGDGNPKLRLLSQVFRVTNDQEGLTLLQSQGGWASRL